MLKIIGLTMIIGSCSAIGISMSRGCKKRLENLKSFIQAFCIIKSEVVFKNRSIDEIFAEVSKNCQGVAADFFLELSNKTLVDTIFAFQPKEIYCCLKKYEFKNDETSVVLSCLESLGKYDSATQSEMISKSIISLENIAGKVEVETNKNSKLYSAVGITGGIILSLMLF